MSEGEGRHPIRVAASRSGISPGVLRSWERRYGVVSPVRASNGRRLYSDEDIHRLALVRRATSAGRTLAEVCALSSEELTTIVQEDREAGLGAPAQYANTTPPVERWLRMADEEGEVALAAALKRGAMAAGLRGWSEELVGPLLKVLADRLVEGEAEAHHFLALSAVEGLLSWLRQAFPARRGAPVALFAGKDQSVDHTVASFTAVLAQQIGWDARVLGPGLPIGELDELCRRVDGHLLVVVAESGSFQGSEVAGLIDVRKRLPSRVDLVVGGRGAVRLGDAWKVAGISLFEHATDFTSVGRESFLRRFGPWIYGEVGR